MGNIVVKFEMHLVLLYACVFILSFIEYKINKNKLGDNNPLSIMLIVGISICASWGIVLNYFFKDITLYLNNFIYGWVCVFCIGFTFAKILLWICLR